ncbi:MAG: GAF domain-containing sensor histidine kinase [Ilumatobacter sp.]|nr:GAF domain-containing sensor histidine kinase [Ilumatobacter sp.]
MTTLSGDEVTAVLDRQTSVMEQLAAGDRLSDVLEGIVVALEELIPGSRCSVLLLDEAGVLRHGAAPTLPAGYSSAIDGLEPGPLAGSCGTAVYQGEQVVVTDVLSDPRWASFRDLAVEHDIGACWSSPIRSESAIVGTFAVYDRRPHEPDTRERELVRRFTHLASIAVAHDGAAREREARHIAELARQTAERANHAKSQFVTALSHELRTPLQSITGFTESLRTLDLSPHRRRQALDGISNASAHILSIVDDVLDLARVEAGAMPIVLEPVDAAAVALATVALTQPLAEARNVGVECVGQAAEVVADRRRLQQVLLNLVSNALRFSSPDTMVTMRTEADSDRRPGAASIHVIDQGPGIPEELIDRLFVPFDRLGADAGREGGAGLGLVLARRLTEAMGGTLDLDSTVGVGTHATITLQQPSTESPAACRSR